MPTYKIVVKGNPLQVVLHSKPKAKWFKKYLIEEMGYAEGDIEIRTCDDPGTSGECVE